MDSETAAPISVLEPSAEDNLLPAPAAAPSPAHWTTGSRVAFRIAFLYFLSFCFFSGNGNILQAFPFVGGWINHWLMWPFNQAALWTGRHIFHLTGLAATWHPTGSGDTAMNWIHNLHLLVIAFGGGLLWTAIAHLRGSRRSEYQTLYAWLRFLLRLTTGMFMLTYGFAKLFPLQMAPISIAILNEPVGQSSPMTLLWSLIGMNPLYQMVCGAAEVAGGVLILFRRTALAGALLAAFVITNVVLYNFFFDVPVKLFALNLLLALIFIILPDMRPLFMFFWRHEPSAPVGVWIPPTSRKGFRLATRPITLVFTFAFLVVMPGFTGFFWHKNHVKSLTPSPLLGAWHLDPSHAATGAFITGDGLPASDLYIDTITRAFTRSTDGVLWRTGLDLDASAHTISVYPYGRKSVKYAWQMPDANHLSLTSMPPDKPKPNAKAKPKPEPKPTSAFSPAVVTFTRTPVPNHYPLLDRGFHFVNQWGLER